MYNDRRYSLARYSINQTDKTVEIAESFSETMGAVAGAAIPVDFRDRYTDALQGSARSLLFPRLRWPLACLQWRECRRT